MGRDALERPSLVARADAGDDRARERVLEAVWAGRVDAEVLRAWRLPESEERDLWLRAARGDESASARLVTSVAGLAFAAAHAAPRDLREDAIGAALLAIVRATRIWSGTGSYGAYVMAAARNAVTDLRRNARTYQPLDEDRTPTPEPAEGHREWDHRSLETLTPQQRRAFDLRTGLTGPVYTRKEIARMMGLSGPRVTQLVQAATRRLTALPR